ncbi:DNA repair protein RadC [Salinicoccus sp. ID82-1]|uniref:JAB domain-containing protein n=1 Tax=Salinicoccus cyprini TaxID=2493691 RepID=A0A558AYI8_9STAP|nr:MULTISPECIES: DNA repair protein RadC [Salinicoccus]MCG1008841.1 DNA repair protein RadC [Salinicoccus sp. ID82-1]TVT29304.1 JAB domain-containing protein [Salinicoccus cyprini]
MTMLIKEMHNADRPRERLMNYGADKLTNQELLGIIINTGNREESSVTVANRIIKDMKSIRELRDLTYQELISIKGIGEAKAITILAVIEVAIRMHTHSLEEDVYIKSPEDVSDFLMEKMRYYQQEHFVVLYLSTKNMVIHQETMFKGSLNSSIVHPREVYKEAVKRSAAAIICVHNHPSGDPSPSREDIEVTKRLHDCGDMIGVDFLDHIIIGAGKFISLKEMNFIK